MALTSEGHLLVFDLAWRSQAVLVLDEFVDVVLRSVFAGRHLEDEGNAQQSFLCVTICYHLHKKQSQHLQHAQMRIITQFTNNHDQIHLPNKHNSDLVLTNSSTESLSHNKD